MGLNRSFRTLLVFFLFFPLEVKGLSVLPLDWKDLTRQAGRIFVGQCLESYAALDERGIPATFVRFQVLQGLKGVGEEEVFFKVFGLPRRPPQVPEGGTAVVTQKTMTVTAGDYEPGREYLLFLYPESRLGFTSPVGGGQGKFQIQIDSTGAALAVNPFDNRFLQGITDLDRILKKVKRGLDD